jgi:hypothetical protein
MFPQWYFAQNSLFIKNAVQINIPKSGCDRRPLRDPLTVSPAFHEEGQSRWSFVKAANSTERSELATKAARE